MTREAPEAASAALDVLLTDATDGTRLAFVRPGAAVSVAAGLARRPRPRRAPGRRPGERARQEWPAGRSEISPASATGASPIRRGSRTGCSGGCCRPTWRRVKTVDGLIADADAGWRAERQARFAASNVFDALAPSNFPSSNPTVLKASVDEGGANLVRGARRFLDDFPGRPSTVDTSRFAVGRTSP